MRKLLPLAVAVFVLAGSRANSAPVPKEPERPTIDGKYTLVAAYSGTLTPKGGFGTAAEDRGGDRGNPWGTKSALTRSDATITHNEITIEPRTATGTSITMTYTLDTKKTPIAIDVETTSVRGKKTKSLGVVEMNGNRLTMALAKEGAERPKSVDEGEGITVYYFQKAPPPPRTEFRIVAMTIGKETDAEKELNKLSKEGYELINTTSPTAPDGKSSVTTIHFILKRTVK